MKATADADANVRSERDGILAHLEATIGLLGKRFDERDRQDNSKWRLMRTIQSIPLPPQTITASQTVNQPNIHGPVDGNAWDIQRLTVKGMTGGTITAYNTAVADANVLAVWTQDGNWTFRGEILGDSETLIFVAASVTGTATISGRVIALPSQLVPEYIL